MEGTGRYHGEKVIALYDYAVAKGADYIFQTDSDGQTNPSEFHMFWEQRGGYDGIFGNRTERGDGRIRKIVENIVCWIVRLFFGVIVPDANAPFRLMSTETVKKYLYRLPPDYNIPNIMMTVYYAFYGERMKFSEVTFRSRQGGTNSINIFNIIKIGWKAVKDFLQFRKEMDKENEGDQFACVGAGIFTKISAMVFLFCSTFIFLMQSPLNIWVQNGNAGTDSSVFKTIAMYMQEGLMPYRDSFDHKGPLIYIYNWLGLQIKYWRGIWVIEFISLFLCTVLLYRLARLVCGRFWACLAVLATMAPLYTYFEGGNLTEEYAMPFIAGALYIFADYFLNDKISRLRLVLCGLSFGAVCMLRINMISVWIVFCIVVLIQCIKNKKIQDIWRFVGWFILGVVLIIVPILAWLAVNEAFGAFVNDYFIFNLLYSHNENRANALNRYNAFSHFFNNPYVLMTAIISVYMWRKKRDIFHFSYCAYIFCTLFLICLSGMKYSHYGMVFIPMLIYPISVFLSEIEKEKRLAFFGTTIYIAAVLVVPPWLDGVNRAVECFYYKDNSERTDTVGKVVNYIINNSEKDDRIIVWGNWNILYILSERMPASKYSYQFPIGQIDSSIMSEFFEEIQENLPQMIIVLPAWSSEGKMDEFITDNGYWEVNNIDGAVIYMME